MTDAPANLWRNREFNLLWVSQALSDLGNAISTLAVPLLILHITGSAVQAGLVGTIGLVVMVVARLPAGVLVDRLDRRKIMLVCDAVRLVAYLTLGLVILNHQPSVAAVLAAVVIGAAGSALFSTAEHSSLRNLVASGQLPAAVARNEARTYATSLAGPPLGGLLFGLGRAYPFLGDALTFLASYLGVYRVHRPLQQPRAGPPGRGADDLLEGLRFVLGNPALRAILLIAAPLNLSINGIIFTIIVTLQRQNTRPGVIGLVETVVAIGGLLGALAAPALQRRLPLPALIRGICWAAAGFMAISALLTSSVLAAVPVAIAVFLGPASNAALFGHQAAITPDRLQGRVVSVIIVVATSVSAVAPLLAGALITLIRSPATILVFSAVVAGSAVAATLSRGIRAMDPAPA